MSGKHPILEGILKGRFSMLLGTLALLFFASPVVSGDQSYIDKVFGVLILAVLASCLRAVSNSRRFFIFMLIFTLINLGIGSIEIFGDMEPDVFRTMVLVVRISYFTLVFLSIMRYVLDRSPITADKICGALSAYILMGIIWSFIYTLFYHVDESCFLVPEQLLSTETVNSLWTIYFSFTTLTTLGYGDVTPQTSAVQNYAVMEAVCGQVFLAVIIARLVALQIVHSNKIDE